MAWLLVGEGVIFGNDCLDEFLNRESVIVGVVGLDVFDGGIDELRVNIDVFKGVHVVSLEVALELDLVKHSIAVGVKVVMGCISGRYRL